MSGVDTRSDTNTKNNRRPTRIAPMTPRREGPSCFIVSTKLLNRSCLLLQLFLILAASRMGEVVKIPVLLVIYANFMPVTRARMMDGTVGNSPSRNHYNMFFNHFPCLLWIRPELRIYLYNRGFFKNTKLFSVLWLICTINTRVKA